jgi:hypothetical protein
MSGVAAKATEAWKDKGGRGQPHGPTAEAMLNDYLIGKLADV